MKVLLVNPLTRNMTLTSPDLGLGYLSTALKKDGHEVSILDCVNERLSFEKFSCRIKNNGFDVIGFKVFTSDLILVKKSISIAKQYYPNSVIVLGGVHPSVFPEQTLEYFHEADFAFCGEAENGLSALVNSFSVSHGIDMGNIPGLIWRRGGEIICNRPFFQDDLDSLGFPDWNSIDPRRYPFQTFFFSRSKNVAPLCMTRGCAYQCAFCTCHLVMGSKVRHHSAKYIIDEIELLKKDFGIEEFCFIDDNFLAFKESVIFLCQELIRKKIKVKWSCFGIRLDLLEGEILKLMEKSGCFLFSVGIESGSQRILDSMKKKLTLELIEQKLSLISTVTKIKVVGNFLLGYPGESVGDIKQTIRFARGLPIIAANFYAFHPLPGTEIYRDLVLAKEINEFIDWDSAGALGQDSVIYVPKNIKIQTFLFWFCWALLSFYSRPKILLRLFTFMRSYSRFKYLFGRSASMAFGFIRGFKFSYLRN